MNIERLEAIIEDLREEMADLQHIARVRSDEYARAQVALAQRIDEIEERLAALEPVTPVEILG